MIEREIILRLVVKNSIIALVGILGNDFQKYDEKQNYVDNAIRDIAINLINAVNIVKK